MEPINGRWGRGPLPARHPRLEAVLPPVCATGPHPAPRCLRAPCRGGGPRTSRRLRQRSPQPRRWGRPRSSCPRVLATGSPGTRGRSSTPKNTPAPPSWACLEAPRLLLSHLLRDVPRGTLGTSRLPDAPPTLRLSTDPHPMALHALVLHRRPRLPLSGPGGQRPTQPQQVPWDPLPAGPVSGRTGRTGTALASARASGSISVSFTQTRGPGRPVPSSQKGNEADLGGWLGLICGATRFLAAAHPRQAGISRPGKGVLPQLCPLVTWTHRFPTLGLGGSTDIPPHRLSRMWSPNSAIVCVLQPWPPGGGSVGRTLTCVGIALRLPRAHHFHGVTSCYFLWDGHCLQ